MIKGESASRGRGQAPAAMLCIATVCSLLNNSLYEAASMTCHCSRHQPARFARIESVGMHVQ
jgi:hypothetical protein